ncbi:hypothetical protein LCGC14_0787560 [marine sediment metagenome]|uniref:Uncharacterized protein n=1 Tax=marine sediment metagenome TaxID=412755 RepID=A0A0F9PTR2_9ZZZZ
MEEKNSIKDKIKEKLADLNETQPEETDNFPSYTPSAFFTKKQIPKAKKKKLRKIARKSRLFNRRRANNK